MPFGFLMNESWMLKKAIELGYCNYTYDPRTYTYREHGDKAFNEMIDIRKNVIWKSFSISCRFPKNRKFGEIVEIAGKFQVTAANFLEGSKLFNFFLNFPI